MLIRSQNKKDLVGIDDLAVVKSRTHTSKFDIEIYKHDEHCVIGRYSTEAKAIKALDMIQQAYAEFRGGNVYSGSSFQMPSDEEVEG